MPITLDQQVVIPADEDNPVITECLIYGEEGEEDIIEESQIYELIEKKLFPKTDEKELVQKAARYAEINAFGQALNKDHAATPPYEPEIVSAFLEIDEVHFRCCRAKAVDSVGRTYTIQAKESHEESSMARLSKAKFDKAVLQEKRVIKDFIASCNSQLFFEGVIEKAATDFEAIGWACIEVIRSPDGIARKLNHIPAARVRMLKGWAGVIEQTGEGKIIYHQMLGQKFVKPGELPGEWVSATPTVNYSSGTIDAATGIQYNFINAATGQPQESMDGSATEVLWLAKNHPSTVYYGYSDIIPAHKSLAGNLYIRDFFIQFFQHNTVPRYAVIIKGATLDSKVKAELIKYFRDNVKGKHHKTIILPLPSIGKVEVEFKKLDADEREGSYRGTRKDNDSAIMTAHGVPAAILGISDTASLGSGKGTSQVKVYVNRVITPLQGVWQRSLNCIFQLGLGTTLAGIFFDPLDLDDYESQMRAHCGYLDRGVFDINEVRDELGYGPIASGNRAFIKGNQITFVDEMEKMKSSPPSGVASKDTQKPTGTQESKPSKKEPPGSRAVADNAE